MDRQRTLVGFDVHKDSIYLCVMRHDGAIILRKTYGTLTPDLRQMCADMLSHGVSEVAMESTATYWVPVWNALCESMSLNLVKPYCIKQLPGRKSDVKDAEWIAECVLKNLIRGSFVPNPVVQDMRKYNRRIFDLNDDMVYNTNKLDAALQRCGFRLNNYVAQVKGQSYRKCVKAFSKGITEPAELLKLVHGRIINKHGKGVITAAVTADFHQADIDLIRQYSEMIEIIDRQINECRKALTGLCRTHFPTQYNPTEKSRATESPTATGSSGRY